MRYTSLVDMKGNAFVEKVEGIVVSLRDPKRAFIVIDPDDATRPAELCDVELRGSW